MRPIMKHNMLSLSGGDLSRLHWAYSSSQRSIHHQRVHQYDLLLEIDPTSVGRTPSKKFALCRSLATVSFRGGEPHHVPPIAEWMELRLNTAEEIEHYLGVFSREQFI